ncbi:MAG: hypothetical protein HKN18_18690 [Silicimonas sp.]|nr:hypothetical protein [Silicimonas sp.]
MNRPLALLVIGLVFGGGVGFLLAAANGVTLDGHDHGADHGNPASHDHGTMLELAADIPVPTLEIQVLKDPVAGWNLHIATTEFTFAPGNAGKANQPGEGHAHVYLNGVKAARVYGDWFHLENLPEGDVDVRVTLNANDHSTLAIDGAPLAASLTVTN